VGDQPVALIVASKLIVTGQLVTGPPALVIPALMLMLCAETGTIERSITETREAGKARRRMFTSAMKRGSR
jgi:hypothetical protein